MGQTRTKQRVTLAAVARRAGVAESTASRVMNGYTRNFRVRPEVRQRVLDAARELKYKPNPMVRSIAAKRTNLIAVIGSPCNEDMDTAVRAAARVLVGQGKHICTSFLEPDEAEFSAPSWRVDGVLAARSEQTEMIRSMQAGGTACVSIDGPQTDDIDLVGTDEHASVRLAFDHLLAAGHEAIVYAHLDTGEHGSLPEHILTMRHNAYESLCQTHGIEPRVIEGDDAEHRVGPSLREKRAGVIAADPLGAMRFQQLADDAGMRAPDEYSLVSIGDGMLPRLATPSITSVRLPTVAIGQAAARRMLERLDGEDEAPTIRAERIAGELIERDTTPTLQRSAAK